MRRVCMSAVALVVCFVSSQCDYEGGFLGATPDEGVAGQGTLTLSLTNIAFTGVQGGGQPASKTFTVTNTGTAALSWSLATSYTSGANWLNFSDASGTIAAGADGSVTVSANITGLSANTYAATVVVSSTDATNASITINVTFTVTAAAVAPVITSTAVTNALAGALYSYQVAAIGSPEPTFSIDGTAVGAGLSITADGLLTWTPAAAGAQTVSVAATNSAGTDTQTFSITVAATGVAPNITSTAVTSVTANSAYSYQVVASGIPAPTFSIDAAALAAGLSIESVTGRLTWLPTAAGTQDVTVTATNTVGTDTQDFTIVVAGIAPSITSTAITWTVAGAAYAYPVTADGVPQPTFSIDAVAETAGLSIDGTTGVLTWTPSAAGSQAVTVSVTNSVGTDTQSFTIAVASSGTAPNITSTAITAATVNVPYSYPVVATGNPAPTFTIDAAAETAGLSIVSATGLLSWVPTVVGTQAVTVTVTNSEGSDTQTFTITVAGIAPIITSTAVTSASAGSLYSYQVEATGIPTPTYSINAAATTASLSIDSVTGELTWMPIAVGSQAVTVTATNSEGVDTQTFTIAVGPALVAPTITSTALTSASVGSAYSYDVEASGNPAPTFSIDTAALTAGLIVDSVSGVLTWTPSAEGSQTVTVTATNSEGTDDQIFTIVVGATSNANPVATDDTATVAEDSTSNVIDVLANDTDADAGDTLTVASVTQGVNGTVAIGGGALDVEYTPDADFAGTDSFDYSVSDGAGGTDTGTVVVTVTNSNDAPDAIDDAVNVDEDSSGNIIDVLANDTDPDTSDSPIVTAVVEGSFGSVTIGAGGANVVYTPNPDYVGTDTFTYTIDDGNGETDTATVTVTVDNTNDDPTAVDDTPAAINEDDGASAIDVLANDTDPDAGDTLTVSSVTQGANGTVTIVGLGSSVTYTPDADFFGGDSFDYTVSDVAGASSTATVFITVASVNDDPTAVDDSLSVAEDSVAVTVDVLPNDTIAPDTGETLTITAVAGGANGTVAIIGGGTAVGYAPDSDFYGSDSFTYTIDDGNGGTSTATVTVDVANINDAPNAVDDNVSVDEDSLDNVIDVLANDTYLPDPVETLTIGSVSAAGSGTVTSTATQVLYTPNSGFTGVDTFTYVIDDGNGGTDTASVRVTVVADADPPGAIVDLTAVYSGFVDWVDLTWTATGDDGSDGTADHYLMRMSPIPIVTEADFVGATDIDVSGMSPALSGTGELASLGLQWYGGDWYLALKAVDSSGNESPISNVEFLDMDPIVTLSPSSYDYGSVPYNAMATPASFTVSCDAASLVDLSISDIALADGLDYGITAGGHPGADIILMPGDSHVISVVFWPAAVGLSTDSLDITHYGIDIYSIALRGTGTNADPVIEYSEVNPNPVQAGMDITVYAEVSDGNSFLSDSLDDIVFVTVDASSINGGPADTMTWQYDLDDTASAWETSYTTGGLPSGTYELIITAEDVSGSRVSVTKLITVAAGDIIYVPVDYPQIQPAINAALDGDMVLVADGIYAGTGNKNLFIGAKDIILISENGPATTIIDCQDAGRGFNLSGTGQTNATIISGFTITRGAAAGFRLATPAAPVISDCIFLANTNGANGGAIIMDGSFVMPIIQDCVFTDNTVLNNTYDGGAIHGINNALPTIRGCEFTGGDARYGGAIFIDGSDTVLVEDSTFDGNTCNNEGGAIRFLNCLDAIVRNCEFLNGGSDMAAAIASTSSALTVEDSYFENNDARITGAIRSWGGTMSASGCTFIDNLATQGQGGAIGNGEPVIDNCYFSNNRCSGGTGGNGGAISATNMLVTNSTFDNNRAYDPGGAIAGWGLITNCDFNYNSSTGDHGGAISITAGSEYATTISGCYFLGNSANRSGGAIYFYGTVSNCTFDSNQSVQYGAAVCHGSGGVYQGLISECAFNDNFTTGTTAGWGGTVASLDGDWAIVQHSEFFNNTSASDGGAILFGAARKRAINCLMEGNTATGNGGGMYINGGTATYPVEVSYCTVVGNQATQGGGIFLNASTGNAFIIDIYDSIVMGNTATPFGGAELFVSPNTDPVVMFCDIAWMGITDDNVLINAGAGFMPDFDGNIDRPPLFVPGPLGTYYLDPSPAFPSPCIDAGSTDPIFSGLDNRTTDPSGMPDGPPFVDMGYHYRSPF